MMKKSIIPLLRISQVKSHTMAIITPLLCISFLINFSSCKDIRNPRMEPTYVCEGDSTKPVAKWKGSVGKKWLVKFSTCGGDELCESRLKSGSCVFEQSLVQSDLPLKAKVYRKTKKKGSKSFYYEILSGPTDSETFWGYLEWSAPYEIEKETKDTTIDEHGNIVQVIKTVRVCSTNHVTWNIPSAWFTSRVIVDAIKYVEGNRALNIEGPGISGTVEIFNGQTKPGNNQRPGGIWTGYFDLPLEVPKDEIESVDYGIKLTLTCL